MNNGISTELFVSSNCLHFSKKKKKFNSRSHWVIFSLKLPAVLSKSNKLHFQTDSLSELENG